MKQEKQKRGRDVTSADRRMRREAGVREAGLSFKKVIMHPDDGAKIRRYARDLYEARGIEYDYSIVDNKQ